MNPNEPIPTPFLEDQAKDPGHIGLMTDLHALVRDAHNYHYHDIRGVTRYPIPKAALIIALTAIIHKTQQGFYNNPNI